MDRERYYVEEGRAHDYLLRCKDCQALVPFAVITKTGCCPGDGEKACGNKRFSEITLLTEREMEDIATGRIDFVDRDKFMAEFSAIDG